MKEIGSAIKKVGITGSSGKTTTKELIGAVLSAFGSCFVTEGNLNSVIGLPMEVLRLSGDEDYAVFEMGINSPGEMDIMVDIVRPDYAVITNIGTAHIGRLGSQDAIALEKRKIFSRFDGSQTGFVFEDEPYYNRLVENIRGRCMLYGRKSLKEVAEVRDLGIGGSLIRFSEGEIRFPLIGEHNRRNLFAAFALAKELGVPFAAVKKAVEKIRPLFGRGEIYRGEVTVILDCYNANYESMLEAVRFLTSLEVPGRRIAVLGDMKELGAFSRDVHASLGKALHGACLDRLYLFGRDMEAAFGSFSQLNANGSCTAEWTDSFETLSQTVGADLQKDDVVLIKGSRSMELEKLREVFHITGKEEAHA
jgi:UDP-N-acetylmuramoyl-tripeptide--D-alanyl-D-alanine ligase